MSGHDPDDWRSMPPGAAPPADDEETAGTAEPPSPAEAASIRHKLWDGGFRPIAILNWDHPDKVRAGKAPLGNNWTDLARRDPPDCLNYPPVAHALNTGILADALQAFDIDIDDADLAAHCRCLIIDRLGDAPRRYRGNSGRCLLLYRAASGAPRKISIAGNRGKIEVLGHGQQFVAHGRHPSGASLEWFPKPPWLIARDSLPAVSEEQVHAVLAELAQLIEAEPPPRSHGEDPVPGEPQADPLRIAAALAAIPNHGPPDWEWWNKVGMAAWRATGGSNLGFEAFDHWSKRNAAYSAGETWARWDHYTRSPPAQIGAGTLFHMAAEARKAASPDSEPPPPDDADDGYQASQDADADAAQRVRSKRRQNSPPPPQHAVRTLTGDAFMSSFIQPDWLIDGIVQRGRLYACTSLTGHGKTAVWLFNACMLHAGRMIGNLDVEAGNVLYLAGENPEDLKARMHGMVGTYKLKPAQLPFVLPGNFPLTDQEADAVKREIAALGTPFALIVGDTASSFFPGDDENDNVQAGAYARTLRTLTECDGNPAVVALCHPVKNAHQNNLLPRGGGAFLNELDANLTLWSESRGEITEMHWHGKIRGPDFSPLGYRLRPVPTGFVDQRNRDVMTVVAEPMSDEAVADHTKQTLANEDVVLQALRDHPEWSFAQIARDAGWVGDDDRPEKWRVQRAIRALADDKMVQQPRKGAAWTLTGKGEKVINKDN